MVIIRFVIIVAPQKNICLQGRIYPKTAVAIDKILERTYVQKNRGQSSLIRGR